MHVYVNVFVCVCVYDVDADLDVVVGPAAVAQSVVAFTILWVNEARFGTVMTQGLLHCLEIYLLKAAVAKCV